MDRHRFSVGFRKDGKKEKYFGFRKGYENQYEATISKIILNGKEILFDRFANIEQISDYELKHVIYDGIWIHNRIHERYVQESLVVDPEKIPLKDVEVWYELHLKGFTQKGKKNGTFFFEVNTKDRIFIPQPNMWIEDHDNISHALQHKIVKKNGKIYYVKYLDEKAKTWIYIAQKYGFLSIDGSRKPIRHKPLYIDSTTYYSSSADGFVWGLYSDSWSSAYSTGASVSNDGTTIIASTEAAYDKKLLKNAYTIKRAFFYFDTSGLPDNANVTSAALGLYKYAASNSPTICAQKGTQASTLTTSDMNSFSGSCYGTAATSDSGYITINFDSTGKSDISKTGTTKICVREYTYDYLNTAPSSALVYSFTCYASEQSGTTNDPKLVIEYTTSQQLTDTVTYIGYGSAAITAGKILSDTVTSTGTGSFAVAPGVNYAATATCTGTGTLTVTKIGAFVSLVSYTSYTTATQQDVDSDIELITANTSVACTVTLSTGYSVTISYGSACSTEESDNRIFTENIYYTSYGSSEYNGTTSFGISVNFTASTSATQQDVDSDIEVILASSLSSVTVFEPTAYTAEITYQSLGHGSVTASFNEVEEILFESFGSSTAESQLALQVSIEYISVGTVTQQDIDAGLETVTFEVASVVAVTSIANYHVAFEGPTGTSQCSVTLETNKILGIDYTAVASIEVNTTTTYGLTISCEATATASQQDEDIDLEVILVGTGGSGWVSDFEFIRCNGAGSVQVITGFVYDGTVTFGSGSSFDVEAITEYYVGIETFGASSGVSQDIDYDVEVVLCASSGLAWVQDLEILKVAGTGLISVTTLVDYNKSIETEGLGSSEVLALKTWKDSVTFQASSIFEVNTDYSYVNLIEFTGYGTVTVLDLDIDIELIAFTAYGSSEVIPTYLSTIEIQSAAYFSIEVTSTGKTVLFWSIEVDGVILEDTYDLEYAKFTDEKGKRSDYFEIVLDNGDGSISDNFAVGNDVYLYLDENDPTETKVFHGLITGIDFEIDSWGHNKLILTGEDYGSVRFGQTVISGAENYSNTTATDILADIILRYCPDITTNNLETFTEQIPYVSFAWEYVSQAIDKIARLVGADYYVDEDDDFHFYDPSDLTASHSLTSSQILNAKIKKDSSKFFDRVFVVGGKQGFLDQSQAVTTTEVSLHDKYYASSFTPSKTNVLYVEAYIKKIGNPLDAFRFMILEDNSGPTGAIVGFGSIPSKNTSTDGSWVKSDYIDVQLDTTKLHWIVFQKYGTSTDTYKVAHDNTTANGHKYSTDGSSWTNGTGKCAFKTYYGVQIVKGASGTKMFDNYTDIPIIDFSIKDTDTALMLAQQKIVEYALKNSSKMEINPPGKRLRAGEVISISIPGVNLEDQTILSVSYEINDPHIAKVKLECTAAEDFYSAFANLFAELRRLKVENVLQLQETSTDYKETTETPSITLAETIIDNATGYNAKFDDGKSKWDVSKWT